jgi:hypothetical protein
VTVASIRHVIEAFSLEAAATNSSSHQGSDDLRMGMIELSAHSSRTSDGHYAGDQFQLNGIPGYYVNK